MEKWIYRIEDIDGKVRELTETEMLGYRESLNIFIDEAVDTDNYDEVARLTGHLSLIENLDPELLED